MTCIVAYKQDGRVIMGGDSAGVSGLDISIRKDSKVFKVGQFLIGYTSSFRMGQILRFKLEVAKQSDDESDYSYMCTKFIDAVRDVLSTNGYTRVDQQQEEIGNFLVGYRGNIYQVCDDLQVAEDAQNYSSVGCGAKYAYGALAILEQGGDFNASSIVREALKTAVKFSGGVRPPFNILTL